MATEWHLRYHLEHQYLLLAKRRTPLEVVSPELELAETASPSFPHHAQLIYAQARPGQDYSSQRNLRLKLFPQTY